jgi:hypothetical protein
VYLRLPTAVSTLRLPRTATTHDLPGGRGCHGTAADTLTHAAL